MGAFKVKSKPLFLLATGQFSEQTLASLWHSCKIVKSYRRGAPNFEPWTLNFELLEAVKKEAGLNIHGDINNCTLLISALSASLRDKKVSRRGAEAAENVHRG
jgi:hypothetical protein